MRDHKSRILSGAVVFLLFCAVFPCKAGFGSDFAYRDPHAPYLDSESPVSERVEDLLSRMTLNEKLTLFDETMDEIPGLSPGYNVGNEALHGVVRPGKATIFPQAIALASSWNTDLHHAIATAISDEARAKHNALDGRTGAYAGLLTFFSPTVNMARDPRWGRTPETYGEDPYLTGRLGVAYVKGMQGYDPRYLKVATTAKHFAANNQELDRDRIFAEIPEKVLHEYFLPAFKDLVKEGKTTSVMSAYNGINGVPCTASKYLLTDILRGEWGFRGYVVSDCGAVGNLFSKFHYAKDNVEAASMALNAGVDLECGEQVMKDNLAPALASGMVTGEKINEAARRVLTVRFRLGMYDSKDLVPYSKLPPETVGSKKHMELALRSAREGIVLLKNEQTGAGRLLPIDKARVKKITVVGPYADQTVYGDYTNDSGPVNPPVTGLSGIMKKAGSDITVSYVTFPLDGFTVIPEGNVLSPDDPSVHGWKGEYYSDKTLSGEPKHVRIDKVIDFNKRSYKPDPHFPERGAPENAFSVRWHGILVPAISGRHVLSFTNDDGVRVYIDGSLAINDWNIGHARRNLYYVDLTEGRRYDIRIEYYDRAGDAVAKFEWREPLVDVMARVKEEARDSDLVIAFMGANTDREHEGADRADIAMEANQTEYLSKIAEVNPNIVLVLVNGGPISINWEQNHIPAILETWFSGEQGGNAIADVLFGDYNPGGRMPITVHRDVRDLPPLTDYDITKGRTYMYFKGEVLYPFGYGLSYTNFQYANMKMDRKKVAPGEKILVSLDVKNTGERAGDEVVQLYIHDQKSSVQRPVRQLKGFQRIHLKPGQARHVRFELSYDDLSFYDTGRRQFMTEPGFFDVMAGACSSDIRLKDVFEAI
ncbi:MAG: glycoside hydrolase family 3 C-terminal domain-containing protein [Oligoflexales bacterium]|nr:glycoside hydrolase family 3 C-terminal domain-containing protein [Oligoflexales bacterium]